MLYVSPYYSPFADARKTEMRVVFGAVDPNAAPNAQFTVPPAAAGDATHFLDDAVLEHNYPELEPGLWLLNGKAAHRQQYANIGWWSAEVSDDEAVFNEPPAITVYFGGVAITTPGTSIDFDAGSNSYASRIRITTYDADGSTIINSQEFENDTPFAVLRMESSGYYYLKIEFLESKHPRQRVRVSEITFGLKLRYDGDKLQSMSFVTDADVASRRFPSKELQVTIDNSDRLFDILAPENVFAYLQTGSQPITATVVINGESVSLGRFFYTSAKATNGGMTATIRANDKALMLEGAAYHPQDADAPLWNAVAAVLQDTSIDYRFMNPIRNNLVYMGAPDDSDKRETLRLMAQAARCCCWFDRNGVLCFGDLRIGAEMQRITADDLYSFDGVSLEENVDAVELIAREIEDAEGNRVENIFRAGEGERVKTFRNPCVALSEGQAVADWLLECCKRRRVYKAENQGDPSMDIGDTVVIEDAYKQNLLSCVTGMTLKYDGILSAVTRALGGAENESNN